MYTGMESISQERHRLNMLEKIQRRATKLMPGLRELYDERLKECGLTTLETRRLRQIEVFQILNG